MTTSDTRITSLSMVAIPVADQDRAIAFYTGMLGLALQMDEPMEQLGRLIMLGLPAGGATVALFPGGAGLPTGVDTGIRLSTANAKALHEQLTQAASTSTSCCFGRECRPCSASATPTATPSTSSAERTIQSCQARRKRRRTRRPARPILSASSTRRLPRR